MRSSGWGGLASASSSESLCSAFSWLGGLGGRDLLLTHDRPPVGRAPQPSRESPRAVAALSVRAHTRGEKGAPFSTMLRGSLGAIQPSRPAKPPPRPCWPDEAALLCFESDAKPLGMSCWVPIFMAGPLWVLSTMEGRGEVELGDASEGEDEAEVEEDEQEEGDRTCDRASWAEAVEAEDVCRLSMDADPWGTGRAGTCFNTVVFFCGTGVVTTVSAGWLKVKGPRSSTGKSVMRTPPIW
ncbi:LOW QUALITY PROTEIN: hypothetical protein CRUP_008983 [Coryphaenoides rupestris]|nr:LOW QUALITY PROTEIN: hypothetical protein CRUP_008983 [Coryphaenoides rupestris]